MTMVGVTFYPDLFAAGVNLFGMVNFFTFFEQTEPWMAAISTTEYGDPKTQADLLRDLSPLGKLDRIKTPLMVQHGANDTNVPVVEGRADRREPEAPRRAGRVHPLSGRGPWISEREEPHHVDREDGGVFRRAPDRAAADIGPVRLGG